MSDSNGHSTYEQFISTKYDNRNIFDACTHGDFPLVVLLWGMAMANPSLNHHDLYNTSDENDNTILHYAAASPSDSVDIVHFLVQQFQISVQQVGGLQTAQNDILNARNTANETPLIRAAHAGNLRVVHNFCVIPGVNVFAADSLGNTAAHHATAMGHIDTLHFLLEFEKFERSERPKFSLETSAKPLGGIDESGRDVLHHAVENDRIVLTQYLLSRGEYDIMRADDSKLTPRNKVEAAPLMRELDFDAESPYKLPRCRSTRWSVLVIWAFPLSFVLCLSCWLPWYLAVPLVALITISYFRALQKRLKRHSHTGAAIMRSASLHPARRKISFSPNVQIHRPVSTEMTHEQTSDSHSLSLSKLRYAIANPPYEVGLAIWLAWVVTFNFCILIIISKTTYRKSLSSPSVWILCYGIVAIELVFLWVWLKLTFANTIDSSHIDSTAKDLPYVLEMYAKHGIPITSGESRLCTTCYVKRPLRSKHCGSCGICVARMDHHCIWINRCVGYGNHRLFMLFVFLHILLVIAFASLSFIILYGQVYSSNYQTNVAGKSDLVAEYVMHLWIRFPSIIKNHLLLLLVFIWSLVVGLGLIYLLSQQTKNISKNITVNESINWRRYHYLQKQTNSHNLRANVPELDNVFDRGALRNWMEFVLQSVDYRFVFDFSENESSETFQGPSAAFTSGTNDGGHNRSLAVVV